MHKSDKKLIIGKMFLKSKTVFLTYSWCTQFIEICIIKIKNKQNKLK